MAGTGARRIRFLFCLFVISLAGQIAPARGQGVITDLSERNVPIEWNFTGTQILIFGAIKQLANNNKVPDVVIVVRGPNQKISARRKERIAGIWINAKTIPFEKVPGYYSTVSSRPLSEIASEATLLELGIGFDAVSHILEVENAGAGKTGLRAFSDAVVRIMRQDGLYRDHPNGVKIIDKSLFRANVSLPANVPIGEFTADIYLFWGGNVLSAESLPLYIEKKGFEQIVYTLAFDYPMLYGVFAVALALLAGLAASALFKRD
jgi:uncharacterized protein (TIGR02186 family)